LIQELKGHENEVMSVAFHPDGRRIVTASPDFTARIWDVETGQQLHVLAHQGEVIDATFSPDGRLVACGGRDRTATIWNADTGRSHVRNLLHKQAVKNVVFSPDGQRLLTRDFRGLRQWDVASGHPLTVHLPQDTYTGLGFQCSSSRPMFSPDGEYVLVSDNSQEAILWHVPVAPPDIPAWFPEFFEAVAGQRLVAGTDSPEIVPATDFLNLRERLLTSTDTDYYTRWARQWLLELYSRDDS
jgi:WD40 repeat protein